MYRFNSDLFYANSDRLTKEALELVDTADPPIKWFVLDAKAGTYQSNDPIGSLDAAILTEHILSPVLAIHDLNKKYDDLISQIKIIQNEN